jgi:hypothetical protein
MNEKLLKFELTVEESNKILAGLAQLPYGQVVSLVQKLQIQAVPQMVDAPKEEPKAE